MPLRRLILFDIDGTLLAPGPVPRQTLAEAISHHLGQPVELTFEDVAGSIDPAIVRAALNRYGNGSTELAAMERPILDRYAQLLPQRLSDGGEIKVYAGARELVAACRKEGWATGILTGNIEVGAKAKLGGAGLLDMFDFGIYGDDGNRREDLPYLAPERAWEALRQAYPLSTCLLVGDTPSDARIARLAGLPSLIVRRREEPEWHEAIDRESPTRVVDSLEDTDQLIQWIKELQ